MSFWKYQDYENKELIIYNTAPVPLELAEHLKEYNIIVRNEQNELGTDIPYSSLGRIRTESLAYATGDIYQCWDDDDMWMPWHLSLGVRELKKCNRGAWMPGTSYWSQDDGKTFAYTENSMEASVLVAMPSLKKYGFDCTSGTEHLPWRRGMREDKELSEHDYTYPFESYAYLWGSEIAAHKTSGNVDDPDNFKNHMEACTDFGEGQKLDFANEEYIEGLFRNVYNCFPHQDLKTRLNMYLKHSQL
jgi:hypothetical protein